MSSWKHVYKVFIASPSDIPEIRKAIPAMFARWNAHHHDFIFVPIMWETHSTPGLDVPGQNRLLRDLIPEADFLVALFWSTIGTPTRDGKQKSRIVGIENDEAGGTQANPEEEPSNNFVSGTVAEIDEFCRTRNPSNAIVSFWTRSLPGRPSDLRLEQLQKLQKYRTEIKDRGLLHEFNSIEDLEVDLHRHLLIKLPNVRNSDYGLRIKKLTLRELQASDVHDSAILEEYQKTHFKLEIEGVTTEVPKKSFCLTTGGFKQRWIGEDLIITNKKWQSQMWVQKSTPTQVECLMSGPDGTMLLQHHRRIVKQRRQLEAPLFMAVPTPNLLTEHYTSDMTVVDQITLTGNDLSKIGPIPVRR